MAGLDLDVDALHDAFDDHPSLSASLEDFEHNGALSEHNRSPILNIASHHSGFYKSDDGQSDSHSESGGLFSPPAERRIGRGNGAHGWSAHRLYQQEPVSRSAQGMDSPLQRSREATPQYESAEEGDTTLPANLTSPLESPRKRPSNPSPGPYPEGSREFGPTFGNREDGEVARVVPDNQNNYIRFAMRAEVQHRTEPFEAAFAYFRHKFDAITSSRSSTLISSAVLLIAISFLRILVLPPPPSAAPDLVKVAGLAKSFEPLIFYSENGANQIDELQETGVAVWDLGESVRSTNMTSATIIVKELDELSESLKTLSIELTRFFSAVDGDVDGILLVMDWAKRELSQVAALPLNPMTSVFDNLHSVLCRVGVFEKSNGDATGMGKVITELFGQSRPQRTRRALHRTFHEFLQVLEESINGEIAYSTALFALFESIDRRFLNLARAVIRESDQQEREEGELLSSLWTRVLGPNAALLRKYERNKVLLATVREKTVRNKHLIVDHNGKLLSLKANLETLRGKLISPLVRSNDSSTISLEEQIRGLDSTYEHLHAVRERQKGKLMERVYGAGSRRVSLVRGEERYGIDGNKGNER
ncbi:MAG: hypothetical protein M1833_004447 [Piccolia ochrophora]|nr:MAG: hypothetical protein M1833_004447 [Piccolia ochrophora]